MIIPYNSGWKAVFDTSILLVIGYSCFTTVYYVAFNAEYPSTIRKVDYGVTSIFFLDFIFNMMTEYIDKDTYQKVRDHKSIASRYFKSGWMIIDFVATFPFDLALNQDVLYTRLIRLTRLSKLIAIFDISRFNRIIKSYYENSTRADRLQSQYAAMFVYRIFRLIIIAFMITYFVGCCWWFLVRNINSAEDWKNNNTFI